MQIRKMLAGLFAGLLLLAVPTAAWAQEAEGEGEAAEEEHHYANHAAEECAHLLAEGAEIDACQEAPNPILPPVNELIWGAIAFTVLFAGLAWKGYPAIKKAMDDRTDKIRNDLDSAERAKAEAESTLADYQRQLQDARNEAARIIEEARQQADQVRRDLTARAEAEAAEIRQRAAEQANAEGERVLAEMRQQVAGIAIELAEKVVESNLDREANMRLIENYINSVGTR